MRRWTWIVVLACVAVHQADELRDLRAAFVEARAETLATRRETAVVTAGLLARVDALERHELDDTDRELVAPTGDQWGGGCLSDSGAD